MTRPLPDSEFQGFYTSQPERDYRTFDQLVARKVNDPSWLSENAGFFMGQDVWELLNSNYLAFVQRIKFEARRQAEREAAHELDKAA